nr:hypothetical protein [uncultured Acetatifactor sp.]
MKQIIDIFNKKIIVFKIEQQPKVKKDSQSAPEIMYRFSPLQACGYFKVTDIIH